MGAGWRAGDLLQIAEKSLGTADGIKDPHALRDDFQQMIAKAMGKAVADVSLRLWTPAGATVAFVKQVFPEINDLTDRRTESGPRTGDYPLGAWGAESRDYHLCVRVPPGDLDDEILAARVSLLHRDTVLGQDLVRAVWTDRRDNSYVDNWIDEEVRCHPDHGYLPAGGADRADRVTVVGGTSLENARRHVWSAWADEGKILETGKPNFTSERQGLNEEYREVSDGGRRARASPALTAAQFPHVFELAGQAPDS